MANLLRGTRLFEIDFAGIEQVLVGWFSRAPEHIRVAKLGSHAALASQVLKRPYDPAWPDPQIAAYFKALKKAEPLCYDRSKRCVHGDAYGLTEFGMVRNFPELFPTLKVAKQYKLFLRSLFPGLPKWQTSVQERAHRQNFLGGPGDHPFGYKHWFWDVIGYRKIPYSVYLKRRKLGEPVTEIQGQHYAITLGADAKRVIAFYPQSTAAGCLKEVMLRLFDPAHPSYVGDAYYGRTPLRAPIHDSLLMEIPNRVWEKVLEHVYREMLRPIPELPLDWIPAAERTRLGFGPCLSIGVEGKAGLNWREMTVLNSPTLQELGLSTEGVSFPIDEDQESQDEMASLGTVA